MLEVLIGNTFKLQIFYGYYTSQAHTYIYIITTSTTTPQGSFTILYLYPWSHLDDKTITVTFKDPWPHGLRGLVEKRLTFVTCYKL